MADIDRSSKDVLTRVSEAAHALGNDPPNGITIMRSLAALHDAVSEIDRLRGERDIYKAQAAAHWNAIEDLQRMVTGAADETSGVPCAWMASDGCVVSADEKRDDPGLTKEFNVPLYRAPEKTSAETLQAPIARMMVVDGFVSWTHLNAPGLPNGIHEVYCEPESVAPYMRSEKASETKPARDADHCDYPDCEQHWRLMYERARSALLLERRRLVSLADHHAKKGRDDSADDVRERVAAIDRALPAEKTKGSLPEALDAAREKMRQAGVKFYSGDELDAHIANRGTDPRAAANYNPPVWRGGSGLCSEHRTPVEWCGVCNPASEGEANG
jgi:hypothetical protein